MKLKIYIILGVLLAALSGYLMLKKETTQDNSNLIVGTASGYAPWVSINENGEFEGFDIDVIKQVAKKMNKNLIIKDLGSMASLFIALDQNKIDAIIWGMSITQDRLNKVAMVRYQGDKVTSYPLLFWNRIPGNITNIEDMQNMTICVEPASSQDAVLSRYKNIIKLPTEKIDDALLNIQYGKADAALVEPAIAKKFKKIYPQIKTLAVPLAIENQVKGVGICIKQSNIKLIQQLTTATTDLIENGTIKTLQDKWDIS
jgi:arginine transport system substrate-binding protein